MFITMILAIVGHEASKFTQPQEERARALIRELLTGPGVTGFTSGACHLGGIDIWAEAVARELEVPSVIFPPRHRRWKPDGYEERNRRIAAFCDELHNIVVARYPPGYRGMRFPLCYHCKSADHVKSGGCWTMHRARDLGKPAHIWVLS